MSYVSPEEIAGQPADARSDLFSLGTILYEIVAGHRAFSGSSPTAIMLSIVRDTPVVESDAPALLTSILERALAKEPDRRYQSASEFGGELDSLLEAIGPAVDDTPVEPLSDIALERTAPVNIASDTASSRPTVARFPPTAVAVVTGIALLGVGTVVWLVGQRPPTARPPAADVRPADSSPHQGSSPQGGAPSQPQSAAQLTVTSDPSGAAMEDPVRLTVTGRYPVEILEGTQVISPLNTHHELVLHGLHTVRLRDRNYFLNQTVTIDPHSGAARDITVPPPTSLTIRAAPQFEHCQIWLDGQIVDLIPISARAVAAGNHLLRLKCNDGRTVDRRIELVADTPHVETFR
jgi:hypothetical protein